MTNLLWLFFKKDLHSFTYRDLVADLCSTQIKLPDCRANSLEK
ncbi:hypothetical protein RchiOBHm_Chr7g0239241 [Rosa chinensis]|uniref:Uncharacterized protein n=1 Tax=Rosa chinensis TaxID=74649 RepID=A0A2P6PHQ6_ROSCH|nr:hypothetical protein RchiOBHm_Chr7g0239241 [Rosa chinensis]